MGRRTSGARTYRSPVHQTVVRRPVYIRTALQLLEDRRLFHPAGLLRAPRSFFTKPRLVIPPAKRPMRNGVMHLTHKIGFDVPRNVLICVRRKMRRSVIIAKRVSRNGGGAKHRNIWSDVKC